MCALLMCVEQSHDVCMCVHPLSAGLWGSSASHESCRRVSTARQSGRHLHKSIQGNACPVHVPGAYEQHLGPILDANLGFTQHSTAQHIHVHTAQPL
jgi:hypothetical protein